MTTPAKPKSPHLRLRFLDQDGIGYMAKYVLEWGSEGEIHPTIKPAEPEALDASGTLDVVVDARFSEGTLYLQSHLKPLDRQNYKATALAIVPVSIREMTGPWAHAMRLENLGLLVSPTPTDQQDAVRRFQFANGISEPDGKCAGILDAPPSPPADPQAPAAPPVIPVSKTSAETTARLYEVHDTKDSKFYPPRW